MLNANVLYILYFNLLVFEMGEVGVVSTLLKLQN